MSTALRFSTTTPIVLDTTSLVAVLDLLIRHAPCLLTVVICSTKDDFIHLLRNAIVDDIRRSHDHGDAEDNPVNIEMDGDQDAEHYLVQDVAKHPLLQPTLYMLTSAANLKTAYCPNTPHTLAYLASLALKSMAVGQQAQQSSQSPPVLVVLNPVAQHAGTRSFSAQGLTTFFSAAVSTASEMGAKLVIAECRTGIRSESQTDGLLFSDVVDDTERATGSSVWDQQIAITNVKAKGTTSREVGWRGRTVSIREVAEKWCEFVDV